MSDYLRQFAVARQLVAPMVKNAEESRGDVFAVVLRPDKADRASLRKNEQRLTLLGTGTPGVKFVGYQRGDDAVFFVNTAEASRWLTKNWPNWRTGDWHSAGEVAGAKRTKQEQAHKNQGRAHKQGAR